MHVITHSPNFAPPHFAARGIPMLTKLLTLGNREFLFRSHNAIHLRRGQQERFRALGTAKR
jgi:hypothetical protein